MTRVLNVMAHKDNNGWYHIKAKSIDDEYWYEYKYYHTEIDEVTRVIKTTLIHGYILESDWNLIRTEEDRENDILTDIDSLVDDLNEIRLLFDNNEYDDNKQLRNEVCKIYEGCMGKMNLQIDIIHAKQTELDER